MAAYKKIKMKILITAPYTDVAQEQLKEKFGEIIYKPWKPNGRAYNEQELIQLLKSAGADALITEHDEVTEKVITGNTQLEFIGVCRGTPSNVAIDAASEAGIPVFLHPQEMRRQLLKCF